MTELSGNKDTPCSGEGRYIWSADGKLHILDSIHSTAFIYNASNGQLVCNIDIRPGEHTLSLDAGIYVVVINGTPYKVEI